VTPGRLLKMVESHGKSLNIDTFPAVAELIRDGKTMALTDSALPLPIRLIFNKTLGGKAALLTPVRVAGATFGLLGFVWGAV
jgi:hypothetical protein